MRRLLCLACVALSGAAAAPAGAADRAPAWASGALGVARESFAKESKVPEGYDREALTKLLFPPSMRIGDEQVEVPWLLLVKPWKASPGLSVAVLETVTYAPSQFGGGAADQSTALYVAVFAGGTAGATIEVRSRGQAVSVAERHLRAIDLAPYLLAPNRLAVGVRTRMSWPYAGGGGENEYLSLFLPDGQALKKVWATLMSSSRMSNDGFSEDGTPNKVSEGDGSTATVAVLKTSTGGLRDLRKSLAGKRSATYRWNGTAYVTRGSEPVENVNGFPEAEVE